MIEPFLVIFNFRVFPQFFYSLTASPAGNLWVLGLAWTCGAKSTKSLGNEQPNSLFLSGTELTSNSAQVQKLFETDDASSSQRFFPPTIKNIFSSLYK